MTTFTVDTTSDDPDVGLTLREALALADDETVNAGADTIRFDAAKVQGQAIVLTAGQLVANTDVTVDGGTGVTIDADQQSRVLRVQGVGTDAVLDSLTITGGLTVLGNDHGGGIRADTGTTLALTGTTVSFNGTEGFSESAIMRTRTLDLRPTEVHGQPRSTATGPVGSLPRRSRSIGRIITPWLRIMLVALGVGAVVGPLPAAADTAAPHGKAAAGAHRQATATATVCGPNMGAQPYSWMGDIAPCIINRRLTDIVIPGSHDSITYDFDPVLDAVARTQSVNLYNQLDAGVRQLDIRLKYSTVEEDAPADGFYGYHGVLYTSLSATQIFNQVAEWADAGDAAVNHGQEIIMINLTVEPVPGDDALFRGRECGVLASEVNMVTPDMLQRYFGKTDPGELTFGQIWSLPKQPGLENVARVIMDNTQCAYGRAGGSAQWGPFNPPGQTLFSGYYADQCYPDQGLVNQAAATRATWGDGDHPIPPGWPKVGGLHVLGIQGTPFADCAGGTPLSLFPHQQDLFSQPGSTTSLVSLWYDVAHTGSTVRNHLNVVSADYIDLPWLWSPIVNMNVVPTPPDAPAVTNLTNGVGQVSVAFSAPADHGTAPITSYTVTAEGQGVPTRTATEPSSPITVTGLTNGQHYTFTVTATNAAGTAKQSTVTATKAASTGKQSTVTATNAAGTGKPSTVTATNAAGTGKPSDPVGITVGSPSPPTINDAPAYKGFVGKPYLSRIAVSGMPAPKVTLVSGKIPPGLTLGKDGTLAGTSTQAGVYKFGVRATNRFGSHVGMAQLVISDPVTTGAPHPETSWERMRAKICTKGAKHKPECASRLLFGPFPRLADRAAVSLVRGPVTYATGHVTADGKLTLRRRRGLPSERQCEVPFGRYTLVIRKHHSTFVPVTLH